MRRFHIVLLLLAAVIGTTSGISPSNLAVVQLRAPSSLAGKYRGYFATVSALPVEVDLSAFVPSDASGCSSYEVPSERGPSMVVAAAGGNCTMFQKVARAEEAGAQAIMLASSDEAVNLTELGADIASEQRLQIVIIGVARSFGDEVVQWSAAHSEIPVQATISAYKATFPLLDPATMLLVSLAVSLIMAGASFATADLRLGSPIAPQHEDQVLEIQWWLPALWVLSASGALVALYFFMRWLIYIVLLVFGLGGAVCIAEIGHACLRYRWPALQKKAGTMPLFGAVEIAQVIALTAGLGIGAAWFFLRKTSYAWPFQNTIGICFCCFFQRSIRLPSIQLAALLLTLMFLFDIFWVFVSPLFFAKSVMVAVAMGGGSGEVAPMLLRIPAFNDPLSNDRMLGYGDIAIPGLLISFLRRHDILSYRDWRAGYFVPGVIGYFVGLCCALVGLYVMQMGQPALLYLVPGTLGTTMALAWKRGEVKLLWEGTPCANPKSARSTPVCKFCPGGHVLQPRPACVGTCDGCKQRVQDGDTVMDCSVCNWYLCATCRPQDIEDCSEVARS